MLSMIVIRFIPIVRNKLLLRFRGYACGSVISRFYEGLVNSNFLNKIKNKVNEVLEHFKEKEFEEKKRIRKEEIDDVILQMEDEVYDNLPRLKVR